jgi:hypothetical protein
MALQSNLFKNDPMFEACLTKDAAHIVPGSRGGHVAKVQFALMVLDRCVIPPGEMQIGLYGPGTANGVLTYKRLRGIINTSYQSSADNIVGKMTIAALDTEMFQAEVKFRMKRA